MNKSLRVLIAEDSEQDTRLLVRELRRGGYELDYKRVDTAAGLTEALRNGTWQIILCDYAFPQFSGDAALRIVKETGADIPFIFVSGTMREEKAVEAMKAGAHDYVMKDNLARLAAAVDRELKEAQVRMESRRAEEMMRASEYKYRHLFESMNDAALLVREENGGIIDVNPNVERLLGRSRTEILGMSLDALCPKDETWMASIAPGEDAASFEAEVKREDGSAIATDVSVSRMQLHGHNLLLLLLRDITRRRNAEAELRHSREQLRALAAHLQTVREEERTRVAREIHDDLGQMLTALKMELRGIERDLEQLNDPRMNPIVDRAVAASDLTDSLARSVQRIAAELRPGILDRLGLPAALAHGAEEFQQRTGITCRLKCPGEEPALSDETATAVFRIFQEAMTNIARHAHASAVEIELGIQADSLCLEIRDNGKGIRAGDLLGPASLGVLGMRERARQLGGDVVFARGATGGTVVALQIPQQPTRAGLCSTS
jgi:PAS domain S-box-containing protein